jgi:hypothetical protein
VGTGGSAVAKIARGGRGMMVGFPKRGRLRDRAPDGQANGGMRGLVAPVTCPTKFAGECEQASLSSSDGSRPKCREQSQIAARNADTPLTTRWCDGPCLPDHSVKAFAAPQRVPLLLGLKRQEH